METAGLVLIWYSAVAVTLACPTSAALRADLDDNYIIIGVEVTD